MWTTILVLAALAFGFWLGSSSGPGRPAAIRVRRTRQKKQVIGLFASKDKIVNDDVQELLNVSDATATRILDELEADGLITQSGEGRGVYYTQN